jgi:hypothetical protein
MNEGFLTSKRIIFIIFTLTIVFIPVFVLAIYKIQVAYNDWYYYDLYTIRSQFSTMNDVHILSERYGSNITVEEIYMTIEIKSKGFMELGPLSPQDFGDYGQFATLRIGDCAIPGGVRLNRIQTDYPPIRYKNVQTTIDNYENIYKLLQDNHECPRPNS